MGKPTGFLEFDRCNNQVKAPKERIADFCEFHPPLDRAERQNQGARCMNCGVPFCQSAMMLNGAVSGCPLHNLIPEWNDELYNGTWNHAFDRLHKTNNFPEFTGRVCPALCEAACTCGMNGDPVTVRENELAIVENAYATGHIQPRIPKVRTDYRIAVVGSGPAGLAAADQLNQRGHSVTVFERDDRVGGLLMYGIPNMKLEKQIIDRRIHLMQEEGIKFITEADIGRTISAKSILAEYDAILLCCGAKNPRKLSVEEQELEGIYFAVDFLKATTKSLLDSNLTDGKFLSAKDRHVVIVGGGDTGNDCVGTCIRHGCASVTQLEMMPKLPDTRAENNPWPQWPRVCKTDYGQEESIAVFGRDPRVYQTTVKALHTDEDGHLRSITTVRLAAERDEATGRLRMTEIAGSEETIQADLLLIAAGFLGCESYVTDAFGVGQTARGTAASEKNKHATSVDKVFTAGDMRRGQSLVVWAIAEGRAAAKEVDAYLMGYTNMI
ncbi:MAG: glutamate synthase subunit beta [Oscillospiraceae bacterium]|jgi:glutamate synthase (NADPH/NADH) small chain